MVVRKPSVSRKLGVVDARARKERISAQEPPRLIFSPKRNSGKARCGNTSDSSRGSSTMVQKNNREEHDLFYRHCKTSSTETAAYVVANKLVSSSVSWIRQ